MGVQSESALKKAHDLIQNCEINQAKDLLQSCYASDYENIDINFAIRSCNFWNDTLSFLSGVNHFEDGEVLVSHWKQYDEFISNEKIQPLEETVYSFMKCVYSRALSEYSRSDPGKDQRLKAETERKIGLCYKKLGSYETALTHLVKARKELPQSAAILAEMADCYELCGEIKTAKILFREAFFKNPDEIDMSFLNSPTISLLAKEVKKANIEDRLIPDWMPVYGTILGVFNVKRELRSVEFAHLQQDIFSLEKEMNEPARDKEKIKPRLLNHYIWLLDYLVISRASASKITEVNLKLKLLDPDIAEKLKRQ